ncbi:hypothetical protein [Methylobacter luteus]|uniref:hypothetical protein n=1 Tax=Methylobacter luteus TaxID=415 RepID=UPI0012DCBE62|nr:hypothetical protein [Methylobacter luteus]
MLSKLYCQDGAIDEFGSKLSVSRTGGGLVSVNRSNRVASNEGVNDAPRRHFTRRANVNLAIISCRI